MYRSVLAALAMAAPLLAQSRPKPASPPPTEQEAGGVFRVPSQFPPDPEPPKAPEEPKPVVLTYEGKPLLVPFACTDDDIQTFGMTCSAEDPCPVYADLTSIQSAGQRIFVAGNFHNGASTMYSLLLLSPDGGKTWQEPVERYRSAGLDQIQFFDMETGWISGQSFQALPRDPFLLLTTDGGATWRKKFIFNEARLGLIEQFLFDSRTSGSLLIDRGAGAEGGSRWERYESMTGGDSWMIREVSSTPLKLRASREAGVSTAWRLFADSRSKAQLVQRKSGESWQTVAAFAVQVGLCKPSESELAEPPPPPDPQPQTGPAVTPRRGPATKPTLRKRP